jgi:hypothetical protein
MVSLSRAIGPIFSSTIFAWSLENNLNFPFNHNFIFLIVSFTLFISIMIVYFVPVKKKGK